MDSLTQAALGAVVGDAAAGRSLGRRALVWGAVAGTLPDLDVLANAFMSEPAAMYAHRGLTHSLFFAPVVAPFLGWLSAKAYARWGRSRPDRPLTAWRPWALLWFAALWTHPLLDVFTTWGTQLLWPFTDEPYAISSIFIIDPAYTLPLIGGLGYAARQRAARKRFRASLLALALSTVYLGWGLLAQAQARSAFADALDRQRIPYDQLHVQPTPLNSLLWSGLARTPDGFAHGLYGLLDDDAAAIDFLQTPRETTVLGTLAATEPVRVLQWFSGGWLTSERRDGLLYVADERFSFGPLMPGAYAFVFRLVRDDTRPGAPWTFRQESTAELDPMALLRQTACRIVHADCLEQPRPGRAASDTS